VIPYILVKLMTNETNLIFTGQDLVFNKVAASKFTIPLINIGTSYHGRTGKQTVTKDRIDEMIANFNERKAVNSSYAINVDYEHLSYRKPNDRVALESVGAITDISWNEEKQLLVGVLECTANGCSDILEKKFRFISPVFATKWKDDKTGKTRNDWVLMGAGVTNNPHLWDMPSIGELNNFRSEFNSNNNEVKMEELKILQAKHDELVANSAKLEEQLVEFSTVKAKHDELVAMNAKLEEKLDAFIKSEHEVKVNAFNELFDAALPSNMVEPAEKEQFQELYFNADGSVNELIKAKLEKFAAMKPAVAVGEEGKEEDVLTNWNQAFTKVSSERKAKGESNDFDAVFNATKEKYPNLYKQNYLGV
jgi:hypothetical protein